MKLNELIEKNNNFGFCPVIDKNSSPLKKTKPRKKSKGIQNDELTMMADSIKEVFGGEVFMNRDFAAKGLIEKWGLTARQTPSRLKKLVGMGILEDCGGSPKSYKVAS